MSKFRKAQRYQLENGKQPFTEWEKNLDKRLKAKVQNKIKGLENGNYSNCSILTGTSGVREARIKTHGGLRLYFAEEGDEIILLLIGGYKDTQNKDIETATIYLRDYKNRRPKGL